jgi:hypothetical protein
MQELFDKASLERLFLFAAICCPLLGIVIGVMIGAHQRLALPTILRSVLIGSIATLAYVMWQVYNLVINALGLDSVLNLVVQIVIFTALGVTIGAVVYKLSLILKRL